MKTADITAKAINGEAINRKEALFLYIESPLPEIVAAADTIRRLKHPDKKVSWIIDRNINITNVCYSQCAFCSFCRKKNDSGSYITQKDDYLLKITELYRAGGQQILLQGGMHPDLNLDFYIDLFTWLKKEFPDLQLHALGPPEIVYLAKKEQISFASVLKTLIHAGLSSLPGAGAEILSDRVRKMVSPAKCSAQEWLEVMSEAHKLNIVTSSTMMFGHLETPEERIEHLLKLRSLQAEKPLNSRGFVSFIPWTFQSGGSRLHHHPDIKTISPVEYLRLFAVSRVILNNIDNLQPSWLTIGVPPAQLCLYAGGNDFGSVMLEENVVASAGVQLKMDQENMKRYISEAGFTPVLRNQNFEYL